MSGIDVTVVIPTKNGLPEIERCLARVFKQHLPWTYEVLVIDSGSTDGTLDVVRSFPVRLEQIPSESFNHGTTRNLGARLANGRYVAFLNQDVIPCDYNWLAPLVRALQDESAAGSFSRQFPRPGAHSLTKRAMTCLAQGDERLVKRLSGGQTFGHLTPLERLDLARFPSGCCCVHRDVWECHPFEKIPYGEDITWANRVIEAGYSLVYEPASAVYHSHDRSVVYEFKRAYADQYLVYSLFEVELVPSIRRGLRTTAWAAKDSWRWVMASDDGIGRKLRLLLQSPFLGTAQVSGWYLGARSEGLQRRFRWFRRLDQVLRRGV